jgi:transposase
LEEELMLIKTILKETIPLQGFKIDSITRTERFIQVQLMPDQRYKPLCGRCQNPGRFRDVRSQRHFKHVPLWNIAVELVYRPRRVICHTCGGVYVEHIPWGAGKRRMTTAYACFLATWARLLPWKQVADLFHCSWGTVCSAVHHVVDYGLQQRNLSNLSVIGIDEISRKRGHHYLTNVYDLDSGTLIWSAPGRSKETLKAFFQLLGEQSCKQLKGICCDMWRPYIDIIQQYAPQACLVFDKFHIVRHLMDAVDQVRRDEIREKGKSHKELVKHTRYIWLKNPWNLTDHQQGRLSSLERLNLKINRAYLLKEAFRHLWSYRTMGWAARFLKKWFWWATHSRLKPMRDFAWMLRRHEQGLLNYFKLRIDNGMVEGLNNKAKVVSHRAYGYRSSHMYITALYHCLGGLQMPQLLHRFV